MAWERLHVLARNPIPPASSDNSLSASFPPPLPPASPPHPSPPACASAAVSSFSCSQPLYPAHALYAIHDYAALTRGPILGLDLPTPSYPSDRCAARGATSGSMYDPSLSFLLCSLSCSLSLPLSCRVRRVAFSNFPYAPTNLRCARKRQGGRRLNVMPLISLAMRKLSGFGLNAP